MNNFVCDFKEKIMVFRSDKITSFSGNNSLQCGKNALYLDKPLVMGILNLTPDSFFEGSRYNEINACLSQTEKMISDGASIIDVGAVSTRPGAHFVSEEEELSRLLPVIEALIHKFPDTVFSVDTFRSKVVKLAAEAGAGIINDISGGRFDEALIHAVASTGLPYILMHMQGTPETMQEKPVYKDVVSEIGNFFELNIKTLKEAGIQQIILDPGFGFGKTLEHNYQLLQGLNTLTRSGFPVLVGLSRKSMIYKLLNITPDDALNGSSAIHMIALLNGADILRVHDVKEAIQVIKLAGAYSRTLE
jgi:dihydropteroate synthase